MLRTITLKTLRDQRRSLPAWLLGIVALVAMYAAVFPSVSKSNDYATIMQQMPEAYKALFTVGGGDLSTPTGYLNTELMSLMAPLLVLLYAITAGANGIAGEEDRHTLDLLLAQPVSRTRLVLEKVAALTVGVALIVGVMGISLVVGGALTEWRLPSSHVVAAMVQLGLLGVEYGVLAVAVGAATGHPGIAKAVPALLAVAGYLVHGLAPLVNWLDELKPVTPFRAYIGDDPLRTGLPVRWTAVLLASSVVFVIAALLAFRRRDIAT